MRIGIQTGTGAVHCVLSAENSGGSTVIKRRDSVSLVLHWIAEDGTGVTALATGSAIHAALRPAGSYSGTPLALCTTFVYSATEKTYTGTLSLNTTEMDTAFAALASTADDDLQCALEITWSADGSAWNSTPRIPVTVENDVVTGSESPPSTSVAPWALPSAGTAGQILQTDGTVATWETHTPTDIAAEIAAAPSHANPADADAVALRVDESGVLGKITWGNVASKFAAASHAASHAGASSTTAAKSVAGANFSATDIVTLPAGTYTITWACTAHSNTAESGDIKLDATTGTFSGLGSITGWQYSTIGAGSYGDNTRITAKIGAQAVTVLPHTLSVTLTTAAAVTLKAEGALVDGSDTATFSVTAVTTAGADPITIRSDQIVDSNLPGNVPLLDSNATLPLANGGTGAATAGAALTNLGATAIGSSLFAAANKADAKTAIGIVNMTPAAYTALVVAGTVDATTLYLLTE